MRDLLHSYCLIWAVYIKGTKFEVHQACMVQSSNFNKHMTKLNIHQAWYKVRSSSSMVQSSKFVKCGTELGKLMMSTFVFVNSRCMWTMQQYCTESDLAAAAEISRWWSLISTYFSSYSKLAFRRMCCQRTSSLKSLRTCQPKLKNVQPFWEKSLLKVCKKSDLTRTRCDKNVAWH